MVRPDRALEIRPGGADTATPRNLSKRMGWIQRLAGPVEGLRVLDCGCGEGAYVRALTGLGADAWGIEYSAEKLASARRSQAWDASLDERIRQGDVEKLAFEAACFDLVLLNEVLEHVPDDRGGLREVRRVLRPGGLAVVFSPNRLYPFETHGVSLRRSGAPLSPAVPGVPWLPLTLGRRWLDYSARNYWPWELRARLREAGLRVLHTGYVWQTFENVSGRQPRWMAHTLPLLRAIADGLERTPGLRAFGVSQLVVAGRG